MKQYTLSLFTLLSVASSYLPRKNKIILYGVSGNNMRNNKIVFALFIQEVFIGGIMLIEKLFQWAIQCKVPLICIVLKQ